MLALQENYERFRKNASCPDFRMIYGHAWSQNPGEADGAHIIQRH